MSQAQSAGIRSLSVVDITGNPGGGTRFVRALLPALQRVRPELQTTLFGTPASLGRAGLAEDLTAAGVHVSELEWLPENAWKSRPLRARLGYKVARQLGKSPADLGEFIYGKFLDEIGRSNVAYFPWTYQMRAPSLSCPMVSTIHDLNFKYFFGAAIFTREDAERLDLQLGEWLTMTRTVTSSQFMAGEISRFYPHSGARSVIRLASFSRPEDPVPRSTTSPVVAHITPPFVLCPTQMSAHKNVGCLIAAKSLLRDRFPELTLVLTGVGSDWATGRAEAIGSARGQPHPDVIGLGYVSNADIDWLLDRAALVINPSLYEAGNGSGLDAWSRGIPVAMSDIPSFREHIDALGVSAALFDPRDPADIAAKISDILDRPAEWAAIADRSRVAMNARTWDHVAAEYLEIFDAAWGQNRGG